MRNTYKAPDQVSGYPDWKQQKFYSPVYTLPSYSVHIPNMPIAEYRQPHMAMPQAQTHPQPYLPRPPVQTQQVPTPTPAPSRVPEPHQMLSPKKPQLPMPQPQQSAYPFKLPKQIQLTDAQLQAMSNNKYNYVSIRNGKWKELGMSQVIRYVKEWSIDNGLFICNNQQSSILKEIQHIRFWRLKKLDISKNAIQSIEQICRLYTPYLQKLNLKDNKIMSIAPLRRAQFPGLISIDLWGNNCKQLRWLSELLAVGLEQLFLEYYDDPVCCDDARALAKLQTTKLKVLSLMSQQRVLQNQFFQVMNNRRLEGMKPGQAQKSKPVVELYQPQPNYDN